MLKSQQRLKGKGHGIQNVKANTLALSSNDDKTEKDLIV